MKPTLLLLGPKIKSIKNSINRKTLLKRLPFIVIGLIFWLVFYTGSYKVLNFVRGIEFIGELLSKKLLSLAFFSLGVFLLLSNIITALSSFYISKDIPFLLSKPVKIKGVLRLKTIETIVSSSWMVISFMPPFFIAYGVSYDAPPIFYIFLILTFIPFLLIPGGIGILIAHLLTKIFPVKKVRLAMLAIGLFLFLSLYLLVKSRWDMNLESPESFIHAFLTIKTESPLLPNFWMTESMMALLSNQIPDILYLSLLLSNGLFMLMLSGVVGHGLYINNLERIQPASRYALRVMRYDRFYPNHNVALLWKDIKVFFRDTGQWSQIFIIVALIFIYVYNFRAIPLKTLSEFTPFIKEIMALINMVMAGLVLAAVSARFLYSSISLEGMAFWILKTSPLPVKRLLWSKFLFGFIPVTTIMLAIVFITNKSMGVDDLLIVLSELTVLLLCISISGLGTGMGAMYPKFKYENIASISMGPGGMLFMLIAFSIVLLTLSVEAWSFYLYKKTVTAGQPLRAEMKSLLVMAGIFILILNGLAFYIPMKMGERRLSSDFRV
jgi:ABC-2 type transport system permease protein